jgi:hypothetical protein
VPPFATFATPFYKDCYSLLNMTPYGIEIRESSPIPKGE